MHEDCGRSTTQILTLWLTAVRKSIHTSTTFSKRRNWSLIWSSWRRSETLTIWLTGRLRRPKGINHPSSGKPIKTSEVMLHSIKRSVSTLLTSCTELKLILFLKSTPHVRLTRGNQSWRWFLTKLPHKVIMLTTIKELKRWPKIREWKKKKCSRY